jgi:hypothetical protein
MKITIEGLKEVDAALGELSKAAGKGVLRRVGRARLQKIADAASQMAPQLSGALEQSVIVSPTQKSGRQRVRTPEGKASVTLYAGPSAKGAVQGQQQEFGNRNHRPQPFLTPAWEAGKSALLDGLAADLRKEIAKSAARAARRAARIKARGG